MKKQIAMAFGAAIVLSSPGRAAELETTKVPSERVFLSASINQGSSSLSNPVPDSTASSGRRTELLLLATVELTGGFLIEAGGGWMHDVLTGTAAPSTFGVESYDLTTDAAVFEISPQVRLLSRLRAGPVVEMLYGEDVSFTPGVIGSGRRTTFQGGLQALYEFRLGSAAVRAGARYLSSLDLPMQHLESLQATLQFGLPVL